MAKIIIYAHAASFSASPFGRMMQYAPFDDPLVKREIEATKVADIEAEMRADFDRLRKEKPDHENFDAARFLKACGYGATS